MRDCGGWAFCVCLYLKLQTSVLPLAREILTLLCLEHLRWEVGERAHSYYRAGPRHTPITTGIYGASPALVLLFTSAGP